ncbi:MAG: hypothetical protein RMY34_29395 [Aulosira sp. DedQUE10]|nr:hypothetical protein [Aulosira sp. DedQUE10]
MQTSLTQTDTANASSLNSWNPPKFCGLRPSPQQHSPHTTSSTLRYLRRAVLVPLSTRHKAYEVGF